MKPTSAAAHGELHNPGVAHETSDVNVRAILWFAAIVTIVTIVCAIIVWGVFDLFERQAKARDPQMSPLAMPAGQMPRTSVGSPFFGNAAAPQLMVNEPGYLRTERAAEDSRLHTYGWVDEKSGIARLPIDEAKKLLVERGLPSRAGSIDPSLGTHAPAFGEANAGRNIPTGEKPAATPAPGGEPPAAPEAPKAPAAPAAGHGSGL